VRDYLADASKLPSAASRERFVLFAASASTTEQYIFLIDLTKLDRAAIGRFIDDPPLIGRNASDAVIGHFGSECGVIGG
jgi:hypothetical protein